MSGIYIHIPFCKQKCTYCDFHFSTTFHSYRKEMISAICSELESRSKEESEIQTIYFGGGTPSLLDNEELTMIFETIHSNYSIEKVDEITLESNPDDITIENLKLWKSFGINRLSIGLQSFRQSDLEWMNRAHNKEESFKSVKLAQKYGFNNITIDLIYGTPNLTKEEWTNQIHTALNLDVQHISAYCLTVEEKTALHHLVKKKSITLSNEMEQSHQFEILQKELKANGFIQYEISNFGKKGFESKHNSNYWKGVHYLGIGPSAHSFNGKERKWNFANNKRYIKAIQDKDAYSETEVLSSNDLFNELILTGLRTIYGVQIKVLKEIMPISQEFWKDVDVFIETGMLLNNDNTLLLTEKGFLMADHIASSLFQVQEE